MAKERKDDPTDKEHTMPFIIGLLLGIILGIAGMIAVRFLLNRKTTAPVAHPLVKSASGEWPNSYV